MLEQRLRGSGLGDLGGYLQGDRRKKIQRGSSAESRSSPAATEMGPSRTTRCRSLWARGRGELNADIRYLKFYSPICSLLAFTQDAHLYRDVPVGLTTATCILEENSFEPDPQLQ